MEPSYFFYLIMPLALLVVFLVAIILYNSRKEEDEYEKEVKKLRQLLLSGKLDKKNFLNTRSRVEYEKNFSTESKRLFDLLSEEKIDEHTYVRLRQVLEKTYQDRLDKLEIDTDEDRKNETVSASEQQL